MRKTVLAATLSAAAMAGGAGVAGGQLLLDDGDKAPSVDEEKVNEVKARQTIRDAVAEGKYRAWERQMERGQYNDGYVDGLRDGQR